MSAPIVVWRFLDGKAGHERQTAGLLNALSPLCAIDTFELDVRLGSSFLAYLRGIPPGRGLPSPALLLGAGRACQWPMLAAQRARGGRSVYCMKPNLPARWFDCCLIPQHDGALRSAHIEPTVGVLNDLQPAGAASRPDTLVLVGGPSRHHVWDEDAVLKQIGSVVFGRRDVTVIISDTRRTPASTCGELQSFARSGVAVISHRTTAPNWLARTFEAVRTVWVTADSVSMLFEVLTAGRALGILAVPPRRDDRITRLAPDLIARGLATSFDAWIKGSPLCPPATPLAEARRCAALLAARWFPRS